MSLPLPQRIPLPDPALQQKMERLGFVINDNDGEQTYVTYTMPNGWHLYNYSDEEDWPIYYFVDINAMVRIVISGKWNGNKGNGDDKLSIVLVETPFQYIPKKGYMKPSETSAAGIGLKILKKVMQ